jgi:hypothetical protein
MSFVASRMLFRLADMCAERTLASILRSRCELVIDGSWMKSLVAPNDDECSDA